MLIANSKIIGTPVLSVSSGPLGFIASSIVNPDNLKIIAFRLEGPRIGKNDPNILDISSIREYTPELGMIVDSADELILSNEVVKIKQVLDLNFDLINLKVETKKRSKLGHIIDYIISPDDFFVKQIIIKRPSLKSFTDPELTISRKEIVEVTDYKVIIKDELKTIKERAEKEDFIPNFVNPFRKSEQDFAPADNQNLAGKDN